MFKYVLFKEFPQKICNVKQSFESMKYILHVYTCYQYTVLACKLKKSIRTSLLQSKTLFMRRAYNGEKYYCKGRLK